MKNHESHEINNLQKIAAAAFLGASLMANTVEAHADTPTANEQSAIDARCANDEVLVFAHRGYATGNARGVTENTREAVKLGYRTSDGAEMDIVYSKDGVPFIWHDNTLGRVDNGRGKVNQMHSSKVKRVRTDSGSRISTLADMERSVVTIARKNGKKPRIDAELKGPTPYAIIKKVVQTSVENMPNDAEGLTLSSFRIGNLNKINKVNKELGTDIETTLLVGERVPNLKNFKHDGISVNAKLVQDEQRAVELVRMTDAVEAELTVYDIKTPAQLRAIANAGGAKAIVDQPNRFASVNKRKAGC